MGYFGRLKKMIISVFLIFGTLPLIIAGIYMIQLGGRTSYTMLTVMGIGAVVFAALALTAAIVIVSRRLNPVANAADKLLETFAEDEKEVLRLTSGKSPVRFIGGTMDYLAGERMAAENHICKQELFEAASLCTHKIIWLRGKNGDSIIVPQSWKERYPDISFENGAPIEKYIHPDDIEGFFSAVQVVTGAAGRCISVPFRFKYSDGFINAAAEIRSVEIDGVICAAGAVSEICETDKLDAKEKHIMYNFAVCAVSGIIYETDTENGSYDVLSKERWEKMFGLPASGYVSVWSGEYTKLVHPDYVRGFKDRFLSADSLLLMPEQSISYDYRVKKKDGSYIWVRHTVVCVKEKDGHACKLAGLITDLSGNSRREQEA